MKILETIGRGFVVVGFTFSVHISEWYQSLSFGDISVRGWTTVIITFGMIGWMILPIFVKEQKSEGEK